jgi:hypothetical protein
MYVPINPLTPFVGRVNFKKNEKTYDSEKSEVFKVLQEEQNDPEPGRKCDIIFMGFFNILLCIIAYSLLKTAIKSIEQYKPIT